MSKYRKINKYQSDVHVYEFNPLENPSQIVKGTRRQQLNQFKHNWFLERGYKQQCIINLGFFHMANPNSLHMGLLAKDGE